MIKIYKIENIESGKIYVGQTSKKGRMWKNYYGSGVHIKKAIKKYGRNIFKKKVLCYCGTQKLVDEKEIFYIKKYDSLNNGYNECPGGSGVGSGEGTPWYGKHHSDETKKKIGKFNKGKKFSDEIKKKMSESARKVWENMEAEKRQKMEARLKNTGYRNMGDEEKNELKKKHSKRMKEYWKNLTPEQKKNKLKNMVSKITPEQRTEFAKNANSHKKVDQHQKKEQNNGKEKDTI
jgi:hypothetical protein